MTVLYIIIGVLSAVLGAFGFKMFSDRREKGTLVATAKKLAQRHREDAVTKAKAEIEAADAKAAQNIEAAIIEAEKRAQHEHRATGGDVLITLDELSDDDDVTPTFR